MNESSVWDTLKMIKSMDDRMWELPNKLFLGTYNVHQLKNGLPNIYVGCLSIILAFLFWLIGEIKRVVYIEKRD